MYIYVCVYVYVYHWSLLSLFYFAKRLGINLLRISHRKSMAKKWLGILLLAVPAFLLEYTILTCEVQPETPEKSRKQKTEWNLRSLNLNPSFTREILCDPIMSHGSSQNSMSLNLHNKELEEGVEKGDRAENHQSPKIMILRTNYHPGSTWPVAESFATWIIPQFSEPLASLYLHFNRVSLETMFY